MSAFDIQYARFQLTDLDRQERFLHDFGLRTVQRDDTVLRLRGVGAAPCLYDARRGDSNRFLGLGFSMARFEDLQRLAALPGSGPVEPADGPGGGHRVRMRMDDGFEVDALHGVAPAPVGEVRGPNHFNAGHRKQRLNASIRQQAEPAPVLRLGHVVLHVTDHAAAVAWLQQRLGLLPSDQLGAPGRPDQVYGTFMRVDRGTEAVDHHCMLVMKSHQPGVHHISFEVQDLDHVMGGHDHLVARGYALEAGVGRHMLGSQIYDYWRDPSGFRVEHYTDGDVVDHRHVPGVFCGTADETTQWGHAPSPDFFD